MSLRDGPHRRMSSSFNAEYVRKIGMTILYEPTAPAEPVLDIVFVHGLQGHPLDTWTWKPDGSPPSNLVPIEGVGGKSKLKLWSRGSKTAGNPSEIKETARWSTVFWPHHFLPKDCPNSRILTWGYDSKVSHFFDGSANRSNVLAHSRDMLGDLSGQRGSCPNRPLVLVAHSLGGIVVKQMLLYASRSDDKSYEDIFKSTCAVFFLGTPHAGSPYAESGETLRRIVGAVGFDSAGQNLDTLRLDSTLLVQCREDFHLLYKRGGFEVYTFQEARGMRGIGFNDKVVPDASSEFLGAEKKFTIDANHRMMCRFSSTDDDGYRKISRELLHISQRIKDLHEQKHETKRNKVERENITPYLDLLAYEEMYYREQEVREAHVETCNWILKHQFYMEWMTNERGLLGIKGKPGSGKSTLMKKIFRSLHEWKDPNCIQLAFFFHRRGTSLQHTQIGMFRSLLHQLLSQIPSAGQEFYNLCQRKKRWQGNRGGDWDWRIEELRGAFTAAIVAVAEENAVRIFIDALDEASDEAAQEIVSYLYDIYDKIFDAGSVVAVCFSCRHFPTVTVNNGYEICLENNNQEDIAKYALAELKKRILVDAGVSGHGKFLDGLQADIVGRASGVFMWVALAVPLVARQYNDGRSLETIRQTLQAVPSELEEVYKHILTKVIDCNYRFQTLHLMQWIYLALRPLSMMELRFAMASDDSSTNPAQYSCQESKDFVEDDHRMKKLIVSLTGGLAEIKYHSQNPRGQQDTVQFIHQSVNDFLSKDQFKCLELDNKENLIAQGHDRLSRSCISYLQLREVRNRANDPGIRLFDSYLERGKARRKLKADVPFLTYATSSWFVHAEKAERYGVSQKDLLRRFAWPSNDFILNWTHVFRLIDDDNFIHPISGATLLHIAAASNLLTTLQALLRNGANVESEDSKGNRAIHYAARWGHDRVVDILLNANADIKAKNEDIETALDCAARAGHETIVSLLLGGEGGDDYTKFRLNSALHVAAEGGQAGAIWLLLERGAEVNAQGGHYGNALQAAVLCDNKVVVQMLLERGAEVNTQGGHYGSALQAAACSGREAIVQMLLERGADVNAQGGRYGNALQAAVLCDNKVVVQMLLEQGAEVNTQGGHYGNALQAAAFFGSEAIVQVLLERGADVNAQGGSCGNALQAAAYFGSEAIVQVLLERGAEVNAQGGYYGNALQAAAYSGREAIVQMLLEQRAEVSTQGGHYGNALQAAAFLGSEAIVQVLLERGAEFNAQGGYYGNALQAAACLGREAVVQMLLERGAEFNTQGGHYGNALQAAAFLGSEAVVQVLLERGAEVNAQGGYYGSALNAAIASLSRSSAIIQLLREHGAKEETAEKIDSEGKEVKIDNEES